MRVAVCARVSMPLQQNEVSRYCCLCEQEFVGGKQFHHQMGMFSTAYRVRPIPSCVRGFDDKICKVCYDFNTKTCFIGRAGTPLDTNLVQLGERAPIPRKVPFACKFIGTPLPSPVEATHIQDSNHAMRQSEAQHTLGRVQCPITRKTFRNKKLLERYHQKLVSSGSVSADPSSGKALVVRENMDKMRLMLKVQQAFVSGQKKEDWGGLRKAQSESALSKMPKFRKDFKPGQYVAGAPGTGAGSPNRLGESLPVGRNAWGANTGGSLGGSLGGSQSLRSLPAAGRSAF